jgi:hypothetical protein
MNKSKGFLNPRLVKAFTFYIISACIILSVIISILAIWGSAKPDAFWRMIATLGVIGTGSAIFAFINGIFGSGPDEEN